MVGVGVAVGVGDSAGDKLPLKKSVTRAMLGVPPEHPARKISGKESARRIRRMIG